MIDWLPNWLIDWLIDWSTINTKRKINEVHLKEIAFPNISKNFTFSQIQHIFQLVSIVVQISIFYISEIVKFNSYHFKLFFFNLLNFLKMYSNCTDHESQMPGIIQYLEITPTTFTFQIFNSIGSVDNKSLKYCWYVASLEKLWLTLAKAATYS